MWSYNCRFPHKGMMEIRVRSSTASKSLTVQENTTFAQLKEIVGKSFQVPVNEFDLLHGFPPSIIQLNADETIQNAIKNQDTLRLQIKSNQTPISSTSDKKVVQKSSHSAEKSKKPNTKSSSAIDNRGGSNIHSLTTSNSKSKPSTLNKPASNSTSAITFGARIATLNNSNNTTTTRKRTSRQSYTRKSASSEEDIAEHLISAVSRTGAISSRDRTLRKVFRTALEYQYNSTKAISRLNAVYANRFYMETLSGSSRTAEGLEKKQLLVKFSKGIGSKQDSFHEEIVDLLEKPLLIELIKLPMMSADKEEKEVLKPVNLSKCSPRIFWSLVFHYYRPSNNNNNNSNSSSGAGLTGVVKKILLEHVSGVQEVDLSFLYERKRELSEKARENLKQQAEAQARKAARQTKKRKSSALSEERDSADKYAEILAYLERSIGVDDIVSREHLPTIQQLLATYSTNDNTNSSSISSSSTSSSNSSSDFISAASLAALEIDFAGLPDGDVVESLVHAARYKFFYLLMTLLYGGSELLRRAVWQLRARTLRELLCWSNAAEGLCAGLRQISPLLGLLPAMRSVEADTTSLGGAGAKFTLQRGVLTTEHVQSILSLAATAVERYSWLRGEYLDHVIEDFNDDNHKNDDNNDNHDDSSDEGESDLWSDELWSFAAGSHSIGRVCEVVVRGETTSEVEGDGFDPNDDSYRMTALIVAYLPPTAEEPCALYRALLLETHALAVLREYCSQNTCDNHANANQLQQIASIQDFATVLKQSSARDKFTFEDFEEEELQAIHFHEIIKFEEELQAIHKR